MVLHIKTPILDDTAFIGAIICCFNAGDKQAGSEGAGEVCSKAGTARKLTCRMTMARSGRKRSCWSYT